MKRRTRQPRQTRTVYFIHSPEVQMVKIGVANDVVERLRTMRTGSPVPLEIAGVMTCERGGALERDLHKRFGHLRKHGEWFREEPELMDFIRANGEHDNAMPAQLQGELICNMLLIRDDDPPRIRAIKLAMTYYPCREIYETISDLNEDGWPGSPDTDPDDDGANDWDLMAYICECANEAFPTFQYVQRNTGRPK